MRLTAALIFLAGTTLLAQEFELAASGGFGLPRNPTVTNAAGANGNAGAKPGFAATVVFGNNMFERLGGEMRYTYRVNNLKVSGGGQVAGFNGEAHLVHYNLLWHFADKDAKLRPFIAGGGGLKVYRGTGLESLLQPARQYALFRNTQQLRAMAVAGGGVKYALTDSLHLRIEAYDYMTPFPTNVISPAPGGRIRGWLHDFVPMVGIGVRF